MSKGGLNELALFAGVGGGILGGNLLGWRTVCAVEIEDYCRRILMQRQNDGVLEPFPIWDDVRTFDGRPWRGIVDVVSGGFPCQDISCAGKGAGLEGARSGLWFEMARIIGEVRPRFVFVENVPLLISRGLDVVLSDLAEMGFNAQWCLVSASDVGASHKRDRIWIMADSNGERSQGRKREELSKCSGERTTRTSRSSMVDSDTIGRDRRTGQVGEEDRRRQLENSSRWAVEPDVGRVAHGIPFRVDRLKAIGNAQVPKVAATAWKILSEFNLTQYSN